jgi:hypothetical protein
MPTAHVVITKEFPSFRGKPERWSNGYNFQVPSVLDASTGQALATAVRDMEKAMHLGNVKFPYMVVGMLGEDAVFAQEITSSIPVGTVSGGYGGHLELCILAQSQVGPRRYLMKYYHGVPGIDTATNDAIVPSGKTIIEGQLVKLTNGTLPQGAVYCRPNGALATNPFTCDPFIRVHQLKRRGKRP